MTEQSKDQCATDGTGPLFERDYSATIVGASCTPEQIGQMLRERFEEFAPAETADIHRAEGHHRELEVGDELDIHIALVGQCKVRVIHTDVSSLTLRTLRGHPEAGRITFGADRDDHGRLVFRIRSRARSSGLLQYVGFSIVGKRMQGRCWIRFINRLATACGGTIEGGIRVSTRQVEEGPDDCSGHDVPTFTRDHVGQGSPLAVR